MNPLISIIIPTYNSEKFLKKCLDSVINQTFDNLEVIIVDGESSDNTQMIASNYCSKNNMWKLIVDKKGVSHQRNAGLSIFKGDYLFFLDSDDYISPNLIEDLYLSIVNKNLDLVTPSIISVYFNNESFVKEEIIKPKIINTINTGNFFQESYDSFLAGPTKLYKRDLVINHKYNEKISVGEDLLFNYSLVGARCIKYDICDSALYYYRHDINIKNVAVKRLGKEGYSFCNIMVKLLKKMEKGKNYNGGIDILRTQLHLFIKAYISQKKIIPLSLWQSRLFMFKQIKGKRRFFYIFPRLFYLITKVFPCYSYIIR